jgi:hypothetical protein
MGLAYCYYSRRFRKIPTFCEKMSKNRPGAFEAVFDYPEIPDILACKVFLLSQL